MVTDPVTVGGDVATGTTVTVENLTPKAEKDLAKPSIITDLTATVALYLSQYPVKVSWQGFELDPESLQVKRTDVVLAVEGIDDEINQTIIEWATNVERALLLCDETGRDRGRLRRPGLERLPGREPRCCSSGRDRGAFPPDGLLAQQRAEDLDRFPPLRLGGRDHLGGMTTDARQPQPTQ